jgi:beta-lactamase regulating signal transducer with metallopeptidase domain
MLTPAGWELFKSCVLKTSGQAAVLVVMILAAQWLCRRRLPARWRHVLWWIVIVRLLVPFFVPGPVSVFNWVRWPALSKSPASPTILESPAPKVGEMAEATQPSHGVVEVPTVRLPAPSTDASPPPPAIPTTTLPLSTDGRAKAAVVASDGSHLRATSLPLANHWRTGILWLWVAGVLVMSARLALGIWRLNRGLRQATTDQTTLELLDRCREQMGVRRRIVLLETPLIPSPALCGYWRPRLLFPPGLLANFSAQQLRFIFLHELAHVRRADILVNWLTAVLQILHWFNPLVWLAFHRLRADRELACDALALGVAEPGEYHAYGLTVIKLLENLAPSSAMPGVAGILEDRSQMKRRIRMIGGFRPGARWSVVALGLVAILALVGLTDAQTSRRPASEKAVSPSKQTNVAVSALGDTNVAVVRVGEDPVTENGVTNLEIRTLTVTVRDENRLPLAGAEVFVPYVGGWYEPRPKRLTDASGRFIVRFPEVSREYRRSMSNFSVSARHADYVQRAVMWTSSSGDVYAGMPAEVTIRMERGISVGGVVEDERGKPLAQVRVLLSGSGYRGFTMGNTERRTHEYSEVSMRDESRAVQTDAAGRWTYAQFPKDLANVELTFIRNDDSREVFATDGGNGLNQRPKISLGQLKEQTLVTRLRDGYTVRGIVVDEEGRPLSDVKIREGYGHGNIVRVSEFTTDSAGRFERTHRAARQWIYTASHADRATVSAVAQVGAGMPEVRLVLPPARPWRARVTDETGAPLAGIDFRIDNYRTEAQILDWSGASDDDGQVVWTNAPDREVTAYAGSKSLGRDKIFKLQAGVADQKIVLHRKALQRVTVSVKAADSVTKEPVSLRRISTRYDGGGSPFRVKAEPDTNEFSLMVERTDFAVGMYPAYEIRLEADGYETLVMKPIDFDSGDQVLELLFVASRGPKRVTILKPDGQPASGARLWASAASGDGPLHSNGKGRFSGDRLLKAQADDEGGLDLPGIPGTGWIIFTHPDGYLEVGLADLPADGKVRLQPYGAVAGRLLVNGRPASGETISLAALVWSPSLRFHGNFTASPDPDGRFSFTSVPPGQYKLYRWALPKRRDTSGQTITETYQQPVTVVAGETNEVEYYTPGRQIVGQAVPAPAHLNVEWSWDVHTLTLKQATSPGNGGVNREDYATFDAFQNANSGSFISPERLEQARSARSYALRFEVDGMFHIDDVPPGSYELRIAVTKPTEGGRRNPFGRQEEMGSLVREVVVTPGQEPLDLGSLTVPIQADLLTAGAEGAVRPGESGGPAVSLEARTLAGKKFSLSQFAGTNVLLVFWATWSERSLSQWVELQDLLNQVGERRLALVGVSLDDTMDIARRTVSARRWKGSHAWVDVEGRAQLMTTFDVSVLPGIFLLDAEGKIVGRELEGDRLPLAVKRLMAKK